MRLAFLVVKGYTSEVSHTWRNRDLEEVIDALEAVMAAIDDLQAAVSALEAEVAVVIAQGPGTSDAAIAAAVTSVQNATAQLAAVFPPPA